MKPNIFLNDLSQEQMDSNSRIFDLIIGRILKRVYSNLNDEEKENMEKIFLSDNAEEKEKFIKKNIPNFEKTFKEEIKKIENDIKSEVEKRI